MATLAFTDAYVSVDSVDLSDWVTQVTLDVSAEALDDTAMGDTFRSRIGGLKDWSGSIEFNQDFAASAPDVSLFSKLGTVVTVAVRPVAGSSKGATNPEYTGSALLTSYPPFGNAVGDLAKTTLAFEGAGTLTRSVS